MRHPRRELRHCALQVGSCVAPLVLEAGSGGEPKHLLTSWPVAHRVRAYADAGQPARSLELARSYRLPIDEGRALFELARYDEAKVLFEANENAYYARRCEEAPRA